MAKSNSFKSIIKEHLDKMARIDTYFGQVYKKENKNLDECVNYILGEAKKRGKAVCMTDEEVFGMAVHYYEEDSIKDVKPVSGFSSTSRRKVELTDEERAKLKKEAEEEYKAQVKKELEEERSVNHKVENVEQVKVPSMFDF